MALESSCRVPPGRIGDTFGREHALDDVPGDARGDSSGDTLSGATPPSTLFSGGCVSEFARARSSCGRRRPRSSIAGTSPETLLRRIRAWELVDGVGAAADERCCRSRHARALLFGVSCFAWCGTLGGVCTSRTGVTPSGGDCSCGGGGDGSRVPVARRNMAEIFFRLLSSWYRECCGAWTGSLSSPADECDEIAARSDAAGLTAFSKMYGRLGRFVSRDGGDAVLLRS